jgi:hypothetical protein
MSGEDAGMVAAVLPAVLIIAAEMRQAEISPGDLSDWLKTEKGREGVKRAAQDLVRAFEKPSTPTRPVPRYRNFLSSAAVRG